MGFSVVGHQKELDRLRVTADYVVFMNEDPRSRQFSVFSRVAGNTHENAKETTERLVVKTGDPIAYAGTRYNDKHKNVTLVIAGIDGSSRVVEYSPAFAEKYRKGAAVRDIAAVKASEEAPATIAIEATIKDPVTLAGSNIVRVVSENGQMYMYSCASVGFSSPAEHDKAPKVSAKAMTKEELLAKIDSEKTRYSKANDDIPSLY